MPKTATQREPLTREKIRENVRKGAEALAVLDREIGELRGEGAQRDRSRGVIRWR